MNNKFRAYVVMVMLVFSTSACEPVSLALLGAGAGVGMGYSLDGYAYKTVMMPASTVQRASVNALGRMGIKVTGKKTHESGVLMVFGRAEDRNVIVRLEPISKRSTQIRTQVRMPSVIFHDKATASAIIAQTERILARG
ncbi:MAG: DUF3568 family protein [Porticoccaceae bacterium]